MLKAKSCEKCGKAFLKNPRFSKWQWENTRYCSKKCSASVNGKKMIGIKHSKEHTRKIIESLKRVEHTKEWNEKVGLANKGKTSKSKGIHKNERAGNWKGDNAKYSSIHSWVQRWKGKAEYCEVCGIKGKKRYHWSNVDHQYKRILDDYISMCVSCHKKYDKQFN